MDGLTVEMGRIQKKTNKQKKIPLVSRNVQNKPFERVGTKKKFHAAMKILP